MNDATSTAWTFMSVDRDESVVRAMAVNLADKDFVRTEQSKTRAALAARQDLRRPRRKYETPDGKRINAGSVMAASMQMASYAIDCYEAGQNWPASALYISRETSMTAREVGLAMAVMVEIARVAAVDGGWKLVVDDGDWKERVDREHDLLDWKLARCERLLNLLSQSGKCGLCGCPLFGGAVLAERFNGGKYEVCAACVDCVRRRRDRVKHGIHHD